jgi:ribosomal protein L9
MVVVQDDHIKEIGNYTIKVKLHKDIFVDIPMEVIAE